MYFAHRPKPMRREVTPRRRRARSYVLGEMPAHSALASTSAAARSPLASSARSQAAAMSIFFGLGARAFDEKVESLIMDSHDGANRIQRSPPVQRGPVMNGEALFRRFARTCRCVNRSRS